MMEFLNQDSPPSLQDYDPDRDSSSSSSGGDHSSPSDDILSPGPASAPSPLGVGLMGTASWPYNPLSLGLPDLSLAPRSHSASPDQLFNHKLGSTAHLEASSTTLGSDFWSTTPSTAIHVKPEPVESVALHDLHYRPQQPLTPPPLLAHSADQDADMHTLPSGLPSPPPVQPPVPEDVPVMPSTNLVAKDAIIAATSIPHIISPPRSTPGPLQLLVLGVPVVGAKSRVETQIKISLVLVAPTAVKTEVEGPVIAPDGGLLEGVGAHLARVGSWSHIRLPKLLALKKKTKKQLKPEPPAENTLYLDVAVVRGSEPHDEIFICAGCQQREHKRAQRKKDAKSVLPPPAPPPTESELDKVPGPSDERRKVVVFNCPDVVEFSEGEVVLPTRITCYCRHHKERKGFSVGFSLRTAAGVLVASGATPPIMITDDHKTSMRVPAASASATTTPTGSRRGSSSGLHEAPSGTTSRPSSRPTSRKTSPSATSPDSRPKRTTAARPKPTPYDSEQRPKKRPSTGSHRSPKFAMTPLTMSKPGSPVQSPPVQLPTQPSPNPQQLQQLPQGGPSMDWGPDSALGLVSGSMDSYMGEQYPASAYSSYSNNPSSAPSPSSQEGWRSAASSPPLSASTSVDNFNAFFSQINSPIDQALPRAGTVSPMLMQQSPFQQQQNNNAEVDAFASLYTNGFGSAPPSSTLVSSPPSSGLIQQQQPLQSPPILSPAQSLNWAFPTAPPAPPPPAPRISRLIPGEGPVHGGIEVTVLGENFVPDLVCVFGDAPAVPTHYWSANTLVCVLPPSANPGPVVVGIKGVPLTVEQGTGLQLFTYKDDSDRSLLELALQVVGLKMTGRLEDASAVAMRIIGTNPSAATSPPANGAGSRQTSPNDLATLALRTGSAFVSAASSAPLSRSTSRSASAVPSSPAGSVVNLPAMADAVETRNFEGIVIKFLSLLDLEASQIPGAAPSLPRARPPISHSNAQRHTLLHLATVLGFHRLAAFLIARRIDLHQPDRNGFTALHFAALYGRVAIARMLLEAGASSRIRNLAGMTALDIARDRDDVDVQEVFRRLRPATRLATVQQSQQQQVQSQQQYRRPALVQTRSSSSSYRRAPVVATPYSSEDDRSSSSDGDDSDSESERSSEEDVLSSGRNPMASRNASVISLTYLLDAEQDVTAEYGPEFVRRVSFADCTSSSEEEGGSSVTEESQEDEDEESGEWDEQDTLRHHARARSDEKRPLDGNSSPSSSTSVRDYANASGQWLSKNLKPTMTFGPPKLPPLATNISDVWEKMQQNPVWERMNHPLQGWYAPTSKDASTAMSDGEHEAGPAQDLKAWMPQWLAHPKSPPPMYSVSDLHPSPSPVASTSALPPKATTVRRKNTHPSDRSSSSESVLQAVAYREKKMRRLRDDRMLAFFWTPVLLIVTFCVLYTSYTSTIAPFLQTVIDAVLPQSMARGLRL